MKLKSFLTEKSISAAEFGRQIGVTNRMTVSRYVNESRIPPRDVMLRIVEATGGAVTADDFYSSEVAA